MADESKLTTTSSSDPTPMPNPDGAAPAPGTLKATQAPRPDADPGKVSAGQYVTVNLLTPQGYRASKDAEVIRYPMGNVTMPLEHAQAMRVLSRIVSVDTAHETEEMPALPFGGAFNDKLTRTLEDVGYHTLADLAAAGQDTLMALGIGPANYERIQSALKGN